MGEDYQAVAQKSVKVAGAAVKDVLLKHKWDFPNESNSNYSGGSSCIFFRYSS